VSSRAALDDALAQLPEEFRAAVVLRDVADLDYAEIASTLGVPIGTVKSRIARGRHLLARQLLPERSGTVAGTVGNQVAGPQRPTTRTHPTGEAGPPDEHPER
jgi:RNA polymerase sigma-70 factor (ECF subfamily)